MDYVRFIPLIISSLPIIYGFRIWLKGDSPAEYLYDATKYWFYGVFIICIMFFIPTTKEYCAIKVIPAIANNQQVQELPNKVIELANEWMEELKPKKDNE